MQIQRLDPKSIPIRLVLPDHAKHCPVVFLCHGLNNDWYETSELAIRLSDRGFASICLTAQEHGERRTSSFSSLPSHILLPKMFHIIASTANEVATLRSELSLDKRLNLSEPAISGISMGGLLSFWAAAHLPFIKAAVPLLGLAHFYADLESCLRHWEQILPASELHFARETTEFLKPLCPSLHLHRFAPRPLLMLNGSRDQSVPDHSAREIKKQLRPLYSQVQASLRLRIFDVDHRVIKEMLTEAVDFFEYVYQARGA